MTDKEGKSILKLHEINNAHAIDWEKFQILDRESNYHKRVISEMLHININNNTINRIEDTDKLSGIYKSLSVVIYI